MIKKIILTIYLFPIFVFSANYFVKTNGDNSNNGLSLNNAWQTIGRAMSVLSAGDTLFIKGGVYTGGENRNLSPSNSGLLSSPIVITNYPGDFPIIDAQNEARVFDIHTSFIVIDSLHTRNGNIETITIWGHDIIIRNCEIDGTDGWFGNNVSGIKLIGNSGTGSETADNITIEKCIIHDNYDRDAGMSNTNATGIVVFGAHGSNAVNNIIRYNVVYNSGAGIKYKHPGGGGWEVYGNTIYNCHRAIAISTNNPRIYHNIIYNCYEGIQVGDTRESFGAKIFNNTFVNGHGINMFASDYSGIDSLYNNIFYMTSSSDRAGNFNRYGDAQNLPGYSNFNCFFNQVTSQIIITGGTDYSLSSWQSTFQRDIRSLSVDPLFEDTSNNNFKLKANSQCIGNGLRETNIGAKSDFIITHPTDPTVSKPKGLKIRAIPN